jgi:hypothetical protein
MELSENIITKLFDTLRKSIDDNEKTLDKSVDAQIDTMNYLKPKIEKIDETTKENLGLIKIITRKVSTMIVVVLVTFAIMTSAYFIVKTVSDINKQQYIEQKQE